MTFRRNCKPYPVDSKELADILVKRLLDADFTLQRYDAYSTDSIYLKLDYGVCNSIRISDHKGKKHLSYRYNIGFDVELQHTTGNRFLRYFFPAEQYEDLIALCIKERNAKLTQYGVEKYKNFMLESLRSHADSKGFWAEARLVTEKES